ncbi:MAG: PDZ domain-containing protein [Nitrospinae bacterium]|nr:PDZ domain-containing protein [Nitrospinota bacterium]
MGKKCVLAVVATLLLSSACAKNYYSIYYKDMTGGEDFVNDSAYTIPVTHPLAYRTSSIERSMEEMPENGYVLVGYSAFNAEKSDEDKAVILAKSLHASAVVFYSKSAAGKTTAQEREDAESFYGEAGSSVPRAVDGYDQFASFWVKKKPKLGVLSKTPAMEQQTKIKAVRGVVVSGVVKGSPAFYADIMKGDVVRAIGADEISDQKSLKGTVDKFSGRLVEIEVIRDGIPLVKKVRLE